LLAEAHGAAERAAAAAAKPGHVAVIPGRRRRWARALTPSVHFDWETGTGRRSDDADWNEEAFTFSEEGRRKLTATVLALSEALEPGWGIRAYWAGDPLNAEQEVTVRERVDLIQQSGSTGRRCTACGRPPL
jgi:hypothetical protein